MDEYHELRAGKQDKNKQMTTGIERKTGPVMTAHPLKKISRIFSRFVGKG